MLKFPENFYWGTATSAYQVEGGIKNDWSEAGLSAGIACDHYHKFEEDFNLAKTINNNAHRFSIEWARIEPEQGKFDQKEIEHYKEVILALKQRNMEPFVTLYHWTLPVWFVEKGGWLNEDAPKYFERFVGKIISEYKNLVRFWITLNEPNVYVSHCYLRGNWPPFIKDICKSKKVSKQLIEAHKLAYEKIHALSANASVGVAENNIWYHGIAKLFLRHHWNHWFLSKIRNYQDFVGINYYFGYSFLKKGIASKGIYYVLKDLKKYQKPIYITENGLADAKDEKQERFIVEHLKWIYKAIEQKIDVRGYFYWSLFDNFEWDKGFGPRFGLIKIDYKTLQRIPRPSSKIYAEICKNNGINL
jgi:beta-glucosidase